MRTLQRWKAEGGVLRDDGRPGAMRPKPSHALTAEERVKVLQIANDARFAALPPARIVPMLADEGVYLASESTFARNPVRPGSVPAPRPREAADVLTFAEHAYRERSAAGVVLGYDLFARDDRGPLVPPVPDP